MQMTSGVSTGLHAAPGRAPCTLGANRARPLSRSRPQPSRMKDVITKEVFVGRRPFHAYVARVARLLRSYGSVRLYARGAGIPKAIDVAMIASRRQSVGCSVRDTRVGTDILDDEKVSGRSRRVSTIAIDMGLDGPTIDMRGMSECGGR